MRKILVTGGAGHIGGSLAKRLVAQPDMLVVVVDNLSTGSTSKLPKPSDNFVFINADVNNYADMSAVMVSHQFDEVFHYAAVVGVKRTLEDPIAVLRDIDGIRNVLDLAKNTAVKRVFYASSSEVYGEPVSMPQHEDTTPLNSRLPYAVVKNVGEAFCRSYHAQFNLNYTILRFFNTYGPQQSEDFVLTRFLDAALVGEDLIINGSGAQTRTFCHVDDNVDLAIEALLRPALVNETVNVGSAAVVTILELAQLIIKLTESKSRIVHAPALKEGDMLQRQPDISKMEAVIGAPRVPLEVGIRKLIQGRRG